MSYYTSVRNFQLDPRYINTPQINLGDGVDLHDPIHPIKSTYSAFKPEGAEVADTGTQGTGVIKARDIINETMAFKEKLEAKEESDVLSQYFKASYGLASVNQSYEAASKQKSSYHTVYALLEHTGESASLSAREIIWQRNPESEMEGDPVRDQELFLARYGSHYVDAIRYGLRIGIQGKVSKFSTEDTSTLSAAFRVTYGGFSVDAGVRKQHQAELDKMGVEILFEATSGGRSDGGLVVVRDFEGINRLLDDIGAGNIRFSVAPIEITLKPYWPTLRREWKNARSILDPDEKQFKVPTANFGVPKGTILPWYPTGEFIFGLDSESEKTTILAPDGWAICDGQMGTPDLRGRFIRGTNEYSDAGNPGGAKQHSHGCTDKPSRTQTIHSGAGRQHTMPVSEHTHDMSEAEHLPEFIWVVYIMKL